MFYAHHAGGRAGTVTFPEIPGFADQIYTVVYEADESCIAEIERKWGARHAKVLPLCLADATRDAPFFLNVCPFTSSMFPFNAAYGDFYQEMRAQHSDYLYAANFAPRQELILKTASIDQLFAAGEIPRVDFLSLDTQGAELSIVRGGAAMIEHETVGVSCEVSFADLYQHAPLFGDLDGFLRDKGFLLASLSTISCGYKRIARQFRGSGMPLQGEALYFMRPERIVGANAAARQRRLQNLAFCALAFGYTELAFDAVQRGNAIGVVESDPIQAFLVRFHQQIAGSPVLPPLWHELPEERKAPGGATEGRALLPMWLWRRLARDPRQFGRDLLGVMKRDAAMLAFHFNCPTLVFNQFERLLSDHGFQRAAMAVCLRRMT
jgi:FkbM family methyltransferase